MAPATIAAKISASPELVEKIKELIRLAQEQGYLTYSDVNDALPDSIISPEDLDEIYSQLRGPAKNVTVLATAQPDKVKFPTSTGENEPMLMAINYGKGRVFHTTLGHVGPKETAPFPAIACAGFVVTLLRGTEWAATGKVTQKVPADFPTAEMTSLRK